MKNKNSKFITKKDYPKFFKILESKLRKSKIKTPNIKLKKDDKHSHAKAPLKPVSNSIYFTTRFWNILNLNEKIAVTLHETGHLNSKWRFAYYTSFVGLFLIFAIIQFSISSRIIRFLLDISIFRFPFVALISYISKKDEFFADKFASEKINSKYLWSALNKLKKEIPPPYLVIIYKLVMMPFKTHPTENERIKRLQKTI